MNRLYIIGAMILLVVLMWINGANAKIQLAHHERVTDKAVAEHEEIAYLPCMNTRLIAIKEAFNGPMKKDSAVANAVSILRECDGHLIEIGSWLLSKGEKQEKVTNFINHERDHFGKQMVEYLMHGMIAEKERDKGRDHKDEGSHHNHKE